MMKSGNILIALCIATFLISTIGCGGRKGPTQAQLHIDSLRGIREVKQKAFLVGKSLPIIDSILPIEEGKGRVVLVASGFDCGTCMQTGIKIISDMCALNPNLKDYMIEIQSPMAINYLVYDKEIHKDIDDILHTSIGSLPTPLILVLKGNTISDMYLPVEKELPSVGEFIRKHSE